MPTTETSAPQMSAGRRLRRRLLGHLSLVAGGGVLAVIVLAALLAPWIWPVDPTAQDLALRLRPPVWHSVGDWMHPLGTDALGRDYLARLLHGARISLLIGVSAALIAAVIGTALGVTAGYFGGRIDAVVMFVVTTRLAMPSLLIALAVIAIVGGSLTVVILVLGFSLWDRFAVVMRAATMQVRAHDYVASAEAIGMSKWRILWSEILPNVASPMIVVGTLEVAQAVLAEAALSFLGLGVEPPTPSWGLMVAEGKNYMFFDPWLITIPGLAIVTLVLAINLLGDGLRDALAPETRM